MCRDVGDILTERQHVLLFGVLLWLLRTRLVDTVATLVLGVIMFSSNSKPIFFFF